MSALPRPALAGPARALNDALHDLHHRAGWPSLRTLARDAGVSHTTVSNTFSRATLPPWGTVELLVEAMGGDTTLFHELWLAASQHGDGRRADTPRIAGRHAELDAVRRHLEGGTGLLFVTGEAGIGKTTLVTAAAATIDTFVAVGRCRPLATPVPLLPIGDLVRELYSADAGAWFSRALANCPAYVTTALHTVLPELEARERASESPDFARQRLMLALSSVLGALSAERPLALLIEDLPWADSATLDVVELLSDGRVPVPLVATWRTDDPDTSAEHLAWRTRMDRQTAHIVLGPLTRDETAQQLSILTGGEPDSAEIDRVFDRSRGQPLFTQQLASSGPLHGTLPEELDRLLAQRLDHLDNEAWKLARGLAVADRPLHAAHLAQASGVGDPTASLRTLISQRLVATTIASDSEPTASSDGATVTLAHPVIAEAVRNRLVPGEATHVHARVAEILTRLPDPPAAEIAAHCEAAGAAERELVWRLRAATDADRRYARKEAYAQWLRVLALWDASTPPEDERVSLTDVHVRLIETAIGAGREVSEVRRHIETAMTADLPEPGRAAILLRAGDLECGFGDVELGLRQLDEAVAINDRYPPTSEAVHVLEVRVNIRMSLGLDTEVRADVERGLEMAAAIGDRSSHRSLLASSAWLRVVDGDPTGARERAAAARTAIPPEDDPRGCIYATAFEAEILAVTGAPVAAVVAATRDAIVQAEQWGFENVFADSVFATLAEAHLRAGDVDAAAEVIEERATRSTGHHMTATQTAYCAVLIARGDLDPAIERLQSMDHVDNYAARSVQRDHVRAQALLWAGRPSDAIACLDRAIAYVKTNALGRESADLLATRARAEADLALQSGHPSRGINTLPAELPVNPFGPAGITADRAAHALVWEAELARTAGADDSRQWIRAAASFDDLQRPHDAAYCRWRAAQAAISAGLGTAAQRLLTRSAADARGHVPLAHAIAHTRPADRRSV